MPTAIIERPGPLARLRKEEIEQLLLGFPDSAIASAIALRTDPRLRAVESFLIDLLTFYLPAGTEIPEEKLTGETHLRDGLGLDSLSMAEAMFKIEEVFDIHIEAVEVAELVTLGDARRILAEKLAEQPSNRFR